MQALIVQDEFANRIGQLLSLPPALASAGRRLIARRSVGTDGPDGIGGRTEFMGSDVCHRSGLASSVGSMSSRSVERARTCSAQTAAQRARSRWSVSVRVPPRRMVMKRRSRCFGKITVRPVSSARAQIGTPQGLSGVLQELIDAGGHGRWHRASIP